MSLFSPAVIDAVERALANESACCNSPCEVCRGTALLALQTAEASLREQGMLTEGKHMALSEGGVGNIDFGSSDFWRGDFRFAAIRIEESKP